MSQRDSGYARKERDLYQTPSWVTQALFPFIPKSINHIWECACGDGQMVSAMQEAGYQVRATDIHNSGWDFLTMPLWSDGVGHAPVQAIITNPPYELGTEFCERGLQLMEASGGFVAMLLRTDFDHAKSRTHLFRDCPAFARKVVLMKRIAWFVEANGKPKASPSFNHAWYIWDWRHEGPPVISYGP